MEYFTIKEIKDQFSELLQAYRRYHLRDDSSPEDGGSGFKEKAEVAIDTFRAAFGNRLTQNEQFLINDSEVQVLDTLLSWTRESNAPLTEGTENTLRRYNVPEAEQCSRRLTELTSDDDSEREAAVWPFIQKIKYVLTVRLLRSLHQAELTMTEFT